MCDNILYDFLKDKPSFMRYSDELNLINIMIGLPIDWIIRNEKEFVYALSELSCSHTEGSGFLEQDKADDIIFENFCKWLIEINNKTNIPILMYLDDFSPKSLGLDEFRKANK
ncbi:hypothetical protein HVY98_22480 [Escherichia fergusonii]|uniref:hypothetical protein n=1 Tax=Escherichia fergusonii TaxID=564 RepID=UPI0015F6F51D|nr:hypothetical protein [Escherichia fergusonii]MBA8228151.1 hypothetical protein [Escherichia fergusonii]WGA67860.1 hypothetical protein NFL02_08785 [Escherichia fergusonii]